MKQFSKGEIATIKRTAHSVNPFVTKKNKLKAQIEELQEEYNKIDTMQEQWEAAIRTMTGGFSTEDLVTKVVEDTGKVDKNGNPVKTTKYVLKYPETVIPVDSIDELFEETDAPDMAGTSSDKEVTEGTYDPICGAEY